MADDEHSVLFRVVFGIVETLAIVVGLALTIFSLMAIVGQFTANFWVQLAIGATAALLVPFLLADRLLPKGEKAARSRGLVTDVLAVTWLGFGFLFTTAAAPATGAALRKEAQLFSEKGIPGAVLVVDTLAGAPSRAAPSRADPNSEAEPASDPAESADAGPAKRDVDASTPDHESDAGTADAGAPAAEKPSDEGDSDKDEMTPGEVFEKNAPAVVSIKTKVSHPLRPKREVKSGGTGFFVDEDGIIATNYHVIRRAKTATVKLWDGRTTDEVWILDSDEDLDLALLEIDFDDLEGEMEREPPGDGDEIEPLDFGDSDDVDVGQRVVAIGNPLGLDHTLTDGLVSQRRVWKGKKMIQVSVPLSPGNSGGPLMNLSGDVIGVSTAKLGNAWNRGDSLNLAVPVNKLDEMMKSEYPSRRRVGEKDDSKSGTW